MISKTLVCISVALFSWIAQAGQIRTVHMNSDKMKQINLKMGQSTVLRFTDKPKKIVIGNQNYYSVEFIENDVTIQPLGSVKTNLFVYTPHHVYGFTLNPRTGVYDDIVNVRWKSSGIVLRQKRVPRAFQEKLVNIEIKLKSIDVKIYRIVINKSRGTHLIDFIVTNNKAQTLKSKDLDFFLTRSKKRLEVQEYVLETSNIKPLVKVQGRLLLKLKEKKGFSFNVHHGNEKKLKIISRRYL